MSNVVKDVYDAKHRIRKNRSLIFRATFDGDVVKARKLIQENTKLRNEILRKYKIIIE